MGAGSCPRTSHRLAEGRIALLSFARACSDPPPRIACITDYNSASFAMIACITDFNTTSFAVIACTTDYNTASFPVIAYYKMYNTASFQFHGC